jgi:hypothetical protein
MNTQTYLWQEICSAGAGIIVGMLSMLGTINSSGRSAQAVEYRAMVKRLTEIEARADAMGETIYRKDRQLIAALDEAAGALAAAERAEARAEAAQRRADELETRYQRLEKAFDELLKRTRMPADERERLRTFYRTAALARAGVDEDKNDD